MDSVGRLRHLLPVAPGKRSVAAFLFAFLGLMVLSDWVGKIGSDSLFVKRFGVEYVPVMYVVTPIAMLAVSALVFSLVDRVARRALLIGYVAAVIAGSIVIHLALPLGGAIFPVAYVFTHGVKETIYLLFWIYVGELYDSEQAKRLFPLYAGAVLVGKILGGVVAAAIAEPVHSENFIGAQAVGFAFCLVLLLAYRRLPDVRREAARAAERAQTISERIRGSLAGYRAVASDELLRSLGVGIFLWYFLMQVGNYLFLVGLDLSSTMSGRGGEDQFSVMYASVYTASTLVALALQVFVTGDLVRRFGVARALFVFPVWYLLTYTGALAAFNFVTATAIQLGERVVVPAIHRPVSEVVYTQVPAAMRSRARAFLSGGVNALGNLSAATLLLAAAAAGASSSIVLGIASVFSVVFVLNAFDLRRTLGRRIASNLASRDPAARREALLMLEGEGGAVPTDSLRSVLGRGSADVAEGVSRALRRRGALASVSEDL